MEDLNIPCSPSLQVIHYQLQKQSISAARTLPDLVDTKERLTFRMVARKSPYTSWPMLAAEATLRPSLAAAIMKLLCAPASQLLVSPFAASSVSCLSRSGRLTSSTGGSCRVKQGLSTLGLKFASVGNQTHLAFFPVRCLYLS